MRTGCSVRSVVAGVSPSKGWLLLLDGMRGSGGGCGGDGDGEDSGDRIDVRLIDRSGMERGAAVDGVWSEKDRFRDGADEDDEALLVDSGGLDSGEPV